MESDGEDVSKLLQTLFKDQDYKLLSGLCDHLHESRKREVAEASVMLCKEHSNPIDMINHFINKEIQGTGLESEGTLFRSNSMASKMTTFFFSLHGKQYLHDILSPLLNPICTQNEDLEVNPDRTEALLAQKHVQTLTKYSEQILTSILSSLPTIPIEMRLIASGLKRAVSSRFPNSANSCVGGLLFLRFLCPAIATPFVHGIVDSSPPFPASRSLILISKVLQSAANMVLIPDKESYMQSFNPFIESHKQDLSSFFLQFADPQEDPSPASPASSVPPNQRSAYIRILLEHLHAHQDVLVELISSPLPPLPALPPSSPISPKMPLSRAATISTSAEGLSPSKPGLARGNSDLKSLLASPFKRDKDQPQDRPRALSASPSSPSSPFKPPPLIRDATFDSPSFPPTRPTTHLQPPLTPKSPKSPPPQDPSSPYSPPSPRSPDSSSPSSPSPSSPSDSSPVVSPPQPFNRMSRMLHKSLSERFRKEKKEGGGGEGSGEGNGEGGGGKSGGEEEYEDEDDIELDETKDIPEELLKLKAKPEVKEKLVNANKHFESILQLMGSDNLSLSGNVSERGGRGEKERSRTRSSSKYSSSSRERRGTTSSSPSSRSHKGDRRDTLERAKREILERRGTRDSYRERERDRNRDRDSKDSRDSDSDDSTGERGISRSLPPPSPRKNKSPEAFAIEEEIKSRHKSASSVMYT